VVPIKILSGSAPQERIGMKPPAATSPAPAKADFFKNVLRVIFFSCFLLFVWALARFLRLNRVLKNKHQAVSQGVRRFGKRSILSDM